MIHHLVFLILFMLGFYIVLSKNNLIKMVIGLNLMEASVSFWVIAISHKGGEVPIFQLDRLTTMMNDPVPQALTLTAIVISASTTALLLTLIIELHIHLKSIELDKLMGLND